MDINEAIGLMSAKLGAETDEAQKIIEKAEAGNEINEEVSLETWLTKRFIPNCVLINADGYSEMCVDALKILSTTAATDFGGSRQRDLAQLWADMTRGYLGEMAIKLFLEQKWKIESQLGHEIGKIEDYLPMDIHQVKTKGETWHSPHLKIGVKTAKWNGIWFDIPGDQFNHSDVHVLVKTGAGREHLFAFFKNISVFKDKVLKLGVTIGSLTQDESEDLFSKLPSFKPIPAYICGFVLRSAKYNSLPYGGDMGRKHYNITSWNGPIETADLDKIREREGVPTDGKVEFESIKKFSHSKGYLFNTGNLLWKESDWQSIAREL